jgi:hypothetical protein
MNDIMKTSSSAATSNKKSSHVFWIIFGLVIALLLWVAFYGSSRNISLLLYYFNWRHWPWWYALNLWMIAFGTILVHLVRRRKFSFYVNLIMLIAVMSVTITYSEWIHTFAYRTRNRFGILYRTIVVPFFYAPVTDFFTDGTVSGRLFIVPIGALAFIALLLRWNYRIKNVKRRGTQIKE